MGFRTTWRILSLAAMALTMLVLALVSSAWFPSPSLTNAQSGVIGGSAAPAPLPPQLSSIPTKPTSTPQPPVLSSLPGTTPAVATIQPSPGVTTVVTIPGSQGSINIPNDAGGDVPLQVVVKAVLSPSITPSGLTVLSAIQIAFTSLTDSSSVRTLNADVTIEISYAGLGLSADQLNRLVIYNASRDEYLPTTLDTLRQVAIARTNRFSTFTLARITGPIPRGYMPLTAKEFSPGW